MTGSAERSPGSGSPSATADGRGREPRRGFGHERVVAAFVVVWLLLFGAARLWPVLLGAANLSYFGIGIITTWAMWNSAAHPSADRATARAWRVLAVAAVWLIVGGVTWTYIVLLSPTEPTPWWSKLADVGYAVVSIAAFLSFPHHSMAMLRKREAKLDAALLVLGTSALAWYFSLRPLLVSDIERSSWLSWADSISSWLVVFAACWAYLRARDLVTRAAIALLMISQVVFNISDLVLAMAGDTYQSGDALDVVFFGAWLFRWAAARWAWHRAGASRNDEASDDAEYRSGIAPAAFVAIAFALLVYMVFADRSARMGGKTGIAVVTSAMTWLLVARHASHLVTTRRQLRAVERQKERFRAIMDSLTDFVFVTDGGGRVTWASASVQQALGPVDRNPFVSLVHPDDQASVLAWLPCDGRALSPQPVHARLRRVDHEWLHVELRGNDLLHDPVVGGLVLNGRDRSEEVSLEGRVRHAEKLATLHDMAGRIAHAFNNVLAVVQGHSELLAADTALDPAWHGDVSDMRSAANRGAAITRQLLGFSGRQVIHTEALDVAAVLGDAIPSWRRLLPVGTTVRLEGAAGTLRAFVDRAQMEQVLLNLVVNARDAMPDGGEIVIAIASGEAEDGARRVLVSVRDSGVGMDAGHLERIFEPFFTTKAPGVGTGLGLAMVDTIVRRAGGEISVSSAVGEGSVFTVSLPAVDARQSGPHDVQGEPSEVAPDAPQATVLLVDDEEAVRNVSRRILSRAGFDVRACSGGAEALEAAATMGPGIDAVVTDMMMPGMSGRELIDRLVVVYPQIPIIVITGFTADVDTRVPMPPQVQKIIEKPFAAADLVGAVRRAVSWRRAQGTRA